MRASRHLPWVCASAAMLVMPALAAAESSPSQPPSSVPSAASAAPGSMTVALPRVGGSPPFEIAGGRIAITGTVTPYVAGQTVKVSIYRQGRRVAVRVLAVTPGPGAKGSFALSFTSAYAGLIDIRAAHYATPQQAAFSARAPAVSFVNANVGPGASGFSVRALQSELAALHYAVPRNGSFDELTGDAVIAYRKMTGLARVPAAGRRVFELLRRHAGRFHVRDPGDGRHVEADLTRQVLAEIEPGGRVHQIYMLSSGKPSTPTVLGRYQVYLKTPGVNSEGMVDSNYFIRGYAIHGYPEVPTYAASHGCLRVPIPDAPAIFEWVQDGTPVDVYYEGGGG